MDKLLHEIGDALLAFLISLCPAALGASVSLAYETGLTWGRRVTQLWVGIVVSYFATNAIAALSPWGAIDPFVRQAIGFVIGMIAFKATPRFIASAVETVADLPASVREMIPFLRKKKDVA